MNEREFQLLDEIEDDHWWFVGKRLILRRLLARHRLGMAGGRLLDLGCGTGGILRDRSEGLSCFGADRSALALRICKQKGFANLARGDLGALPFATGSFDMVLALDVIEHLDDDVGFLRNASALCAPGGRLIVSVPAYQFLWSRHDETFEHRRRYGASQLKEVVRNAGFTPERITYTNALIFPAAAVWRILSRYLSRVRRAPPHDFLPVAHWLNALLVRAYHLEAWLLGHLDLPFGLSVVCVARKP